MKGWLDAAEPSITADAAGVPEWHDQRAAVATLRAIYLLSRSDTEGARRQAGVAVRLETDPAVPGYAVCRHILGTVCLAGDRRSEAIPVLADSVHQAKALYQFPLLTLQAGCDLALALYDSGRFVEAQRVCTEVADAARTVENTWGDAAAAGIARLRMVEGRLAHRAGDVAAAVQILRRSVALSRIWGVPTQLVMALTGLAEAELSAGQQGQARAAASEAREMVDTEPVWPFVIRDLEATERRVGREYVKAARRPGILAEDLTDRELSILRMLPGTANQREIGAALFLSINTVKGYAKSLYRKLDVSTRQEAVDRARELNLI
jgi:LuxR family maltose regulon positive regulatory protein